MSAVHVEHGAEGVFRGILHDRLSAVLKWGSGTALCLTLAGLLLKAASGQVGAGPSMAMPVHDLVVAGTLLSVEGLLNLGLLVLLITPVLCVAMAAASFISRRDWRYGAISLAALVLVAVSLAGSL